MNKSKIYKNTFFSIEVIKEAIDRLETIGNCPDIEPSSLLISFENEKWEHDNISEFFSDYLNNPQWVHFNIHHKKNGFSVNFQSAYNETEISVNGNIREEIELILNAFDINAEKCKISDDLKSHKSIPTIFIGHGRKDYWKELADHLHYKHDFKIEAFETGERAGHTIRDILESMLDKSSFALLVLSGEDLMATNEIRARQNVIHEAGLFQGRLGFNRAIMLVEEGIENFSNVDGIQQIRFKNGNIRETFGDVLATIKREFNL